MSVYSYHNAPDDHSSNVDPLTDSPLLVEPQVHSSEELEEANRRYFNLSDIDSPETIFYMSAMSHGKYPMRYYWIATGIIALVALGLGLLIGFLAAPSSDTTTYPDSYQIWLDALKEEDDWVTEKMLEILDKDKIEQHLSYLTSTPHLAGTPGDKVTAEYIRDELNKYKLDSVEIIPYDVLLSFPDEDQTNHVYIHNSGGDVIFKTHAYEKPLTEQENRSDIVPPFNAYAKNGTVSGELIYVNYARVEDFMFLETNMSVNFTGKIVLSRYGKIFRGDKVKHAEMFGALGMILYSDPADYATDGATDVYPDSWWLPGTGVQRGTLWINSGDPLTPGYPSLDSAYREEGDIDGLPNIPVHPIGYNDAVEILRQIDGDKAPASWQGKLDTVYNIGPQMKNNSYVTLEVHNVQRRNYTYTTVGYIKGSLEPDRYVILGNHHDAWVFGALDPSSGTACLLEIARVFKVLVDQHGWKPRRSIVFCSWGAEEYGLIGSTEWVEENMKSLSSKAVVYLNVDISVQGNYVFRAKSSPTLYQVIYDVAKKIPDPNGGSLYDIWLKRNPMKEESLPYIGNLGSGSDYAPFMVTAGISSLDIRYTYDSATNLSSYPLYHSMYETFHLVKEHLDPEFLYHDVVTKFWAEMGRTFSDSLILPFNCEDYGTKMTSSMNSIKEAYEDLMNDEGIYFDDFDAALNEFIDAAHSFHQYIVELNEDDPLEVRKINDKLMYLERAFIDPLGLPGRPFHRHLVFAPSSKNSYFGDAFPGLLDALFNIENLPEEEAHQQWKVVDKHLSVLTAFMHGAAITLKEAN